MTQLCTVEAPPRPSPAPEVPATALALTKAVIETMTGRRSLHQLEMAVGLDVYDLIAAHARRGRLRGARPASVRAQMPHGGAVEAVVSLVLPTRRLIPCAVRLDLIEARWLCTGLVVLEPMGRRR